MIFKNTSHRAQRSMTLLGVGLVAVTLVMAACSSSAKPTSTATTVPVATTASGSGGLAAAQSFVNKYEQQPAQITDTAKVTGTIPSGKTVDFIPCGPNPECQQEGTIVKQAASLIGWHEVTISNDGTPQGDKAAFNDVVRNKPAGVLYTAIPLAVFQSDVSSLEANGTVVSACCVTDPVGTGVDYNVDDAAEGDIVGQAQAAILAVNSSCTDADSVIVNIPDFAILANGIASYKQWMATYCPSATVDELNIALANLADGNTTIVSYLRAHTNVKYVVASTDGLTVGLPAALTAAGLTTKIIGQGATPTNVQYLKAGQEVGDVAFPYDEVMYAMFTAVLQKAAGGTITPSVAPPLWILTASNAPGSGAAIFPVVANYQTEYESLWGKG